MDYITVPQAAKYLNVSVQAVYKQIRRGVIKAEKLSNKTYTTVTWLHEYLEHKHDKTHHAVYNGRPAFDEEKGNLSVGLCAKRLNLNRRYILNHIYSGHLIAVRKGHYYMIKEAELQRFAQEYLKVKIA